MKRVTIHTDGACKGNPGPGAYGAVLEHGKNRKEISAAYKLTTNNRMEILAAAAALELLKEPCEVVIFSDSKYLVHAFTQNWVSGWQRRDWKTSDKKPVKNRDLWERLLRAMAKHKIEWHWLKGHAGHTHNERCDTLANEAIAKGPLADDDGFRNDDDLFT